MGGLEGDPIDLLLGLLTFSPNEVSHRHPPSGTRSLGLSYGTVSSLGWVPRAPGSLLSEQTPLCTP